MLPAFMRRPNKIQFLTTSKPIDAAIAQLNSHSNRFESISKLQFEAAFFESSGAAFSLKCERTLIDSVSHSSLSCRVEPIFGTGFIGFPIECTAKKIRFSL